jgi:hypothetical protein
MQHDCEQDCDQGRACVAPGKCMATVRQAREYLPHPTAPLQLAPGAIEGYRVGLLGTPAQRRELMRWLKPALAFSLTVALCGLAAGVIAGRFFP